MKIKILLLYLCLFLFFASCIKLKHEMTIQPIHVTVEITVKIDKELENFFGDIDKAAEKTKIEQDKPAQEKEEKKEDKNEN